MDVKFELSNHSDKVEKKIKIFEKAVDTKKIKLNPIKIEKIFLAVDAHSEATEINENALQITLNIAKKQQAEVNIACIAPTTEELKISEKLVKKALKLLKTEEIKVTGSCGYGHPSEKILEISNHYNPSLIVLPTPYGERAEPFNIESLGTSVDLILRKSPFPTLLVRKPKYPPSEIMNSILLIIDSNKTIKAAEWALTLAKDKTKMMLLSITEKDTIEKVEELAESLLESEIDKDIVKKIHQEENQDLINGIFHEAKSKGTKIEKKHIIGDKIRLILEEAKEKSTILILATTLEQNNVFENEVENICRLIQIPILIIKN
jgi:nucleotide-binding universal stress UspA family protein